MTTQEVLDGQRKLSKVLLRSPAYWHRRAWGFENVTLTQEKERAKRREHIVRERGETTRWRREDSAPLATTLPQLSVSRENCKIGKVKMSSMAPQIC